FLNGATPTSLDGVSVVITQFGAPRLAPIGYVSPGQVNFLLPIDAIPAPTQVQFKNPAGMTAPFSLTVQASAPQLWTTDGKQVAGTKSNGTALTSAAPGETVVLFAAGLGNTTPGLVAGQTPTAGTPLAQLPAVTIGGATAEVSSGSILGPGLYQLRVV